MVVVYFFSRIMWFLHFSFFVCVLVSLCFFLFFFYFFFGLFCFTSPLVVDAVAHWAVTVRCFVCLFCLCFWFYCFLCLFCFCSYFVFGLFSCPGQLNKWHCLSLGRSLGAN